MLNLEQCLEELALESQEYAHLAETKHHESPNFKVHVPKVMPGIPFGKANTWVEGVNTSLYSNAQECKITAATTVTCQNFLTLPRYVTSDFEHKADVNDLLHPGEVFITDVMNGNVKDMRLEEIL